MQPMTRISATGPGTWAQTTRLGVASSGNLAQVQVQGQYAGVALALALGLVAYLVLKPHLDVEARAGVGR